MRELFGRKARHRRWLLGLYHLGTKIREDGLFAIEHDLNRHLDDPRSPLHTIRSDRCAVTLTTDMLHLVLAESINPIELAVYAQDAIDGYGRLPIIRRPDLDLLKLVARALNGFFSGYSIVTSLEFGRQALPPRTRPTLHEFRLLLVTARPNASPKPSSLIAAGFPAAAPA